MRRFMKVDWLHDLADEPVVLYSEVINGEETRKVEVYRDGRMDYACEGVETGSTQLSSELMPTVKELDEQPEFAAVAITAEEFEDLWARATVARSTPSD